MFWRNEGYYHVEPAIQSRVSQQILPVIAYALRLRFEPSLLLQLRVYQQLSCDGLRSRSSPFKVG